MARRSATPTGYTILVVDDQPEILQSTSRLLSRQGHRVLTACSGEEALDLFSGEPVHLLIVDYFMPGMSGAEVVRRIREKDDTVQILLQTGYSGEKPAHQVLDSLDIQGYHDKGDGAEKLLVWVRVCLKAHRQLEHVREAERLKGEFLANMSHEFRTPLNGILGTTEMLLDSELGPQQQQYARMLLRSAENLLDTINDVLDIAKIESGRMKLEMEALSPRDVVQQTLDLLSPAAVKRGLGLSGNVSDAVPESLVGDRQRLRQVLVNLVGNAVKFTESGSIAVEARVASEDADAVVLNFSVSDTGIGIPADKQESIFDTFVQADGSNTRPYDGTGLGLSISAQLVGLMSGRIWVESEVGRGSTFHFIVRLPRSRQPESVVESAQPAIG